MSEITSRAAGHRIAPRLKSTPKSTTVEWRVVDIPRDLPRSEALAMLNEQAEYGSWELARSVTFIGGARRVWLKRRRMRVYRTDMLS